jgi:hypothetical protein
LIFLVSKDAKEIDTQEEGLKNQEKGQLNYTKG